MSLVERAAKRLEELAKAGSQVAGDLAHPPSRRAKPREPDRTCSPEARACRCEAGRPAGRSSSDAGGGRRRSSSATTSEPSRSRASRAHAWRARQREQSDRRERAAAHCEQRRGQAQRVELDLPKLASAGYLEPDDPESIDGQRVPQDQAAAHSSLPGQVGGARRACQPHHGDQLGSG